MTGWLPAPVEELFGPEATAEESYEVLTVDVPPASWIAALDTARTTLGCSYFDWLSAVDEPGTGFRVAAHVVALSPVRRLLVRTTVPHAAPVLASAVSVYAGAGWHERETHEMFGVTFEGHPGLDPLLLPEGFEGHPLRKDFVLAARVAKAWPGAKEPGESDHGGPKRRQMLPPGVPDPNDWGPLKGQLPLRPPPVRLAAAPAPPRATARCAGRARRETVPPARRPPPERGVAVPVPMSVLVLVLVLVSMRVRVPRRRPVVRAARVRVPRARVPRLRVPRVRAPQVRHPWIEAPRMNRPRSRTPTGRRLRQRLPAPAARAVQVRGRLPSGPRERGRPRR